MRFLRYSSFWLGFPYPDCWRAGSQLHSRRDSRGEKAGQLLRILVTLSFLSVLFLSENCFALSPSELCAADIDGDHLIGYGDVVIILTNWSGELPTDEPGDVDGDGKVNLLDLVIVLSHYGEVADCTRASDQRFSDHGKTHPECVDTDGGQVIDVKGTTSLYSDINSPSPLFSHTDFCLPPNILNERKVMEHYCSIGEDGRSIVRRRIILCGYPHPDKEVQGDEYNLDWCEDGRCMNLVPCSSDSECGTEKISDPYCLNEEECRDKLSPRCFFPGLPNAHCGFDIETICTPCPAGGVCDEVEGICHQREICERPVDVALVIDRSGSMSQPCSDGSCSLKLNAVREAVNGFLSVLPSEDRFALTDFSSSTMPHWYQPYTFDRALLSQLLSSLFAHGGTFIEQSLAFSAEQGSENARDNVPKVAIVLSDGEIQDLPADDSENDDAVSALLALHGSGTTVYAIGFDIDTGSDAEYKLKQLVATDPVHYYSASGAQELELVYQTLTSIICSCGNGALDEGEECDDGNNVGGDGCAPNCRVE
ncbi:MAG: VWA domain-containing protein [Bdellovibrionales bacterium]|nr:VWA domain-containing protein [Bdellovibrionales bacterium]